MGQIQSLDELIGLLIRRRLLIAAVTILGTLVSLYIGATRPKFYQADAVIQVEVPTVAAVAGSTQPQAAGSGQLLQSIEQRLTTRDALIAMIDRQGLFTDLPALSTSQKVDLLRQSVTFQPVASVASPAFGATAQISAIIISTRMSDPEKAARVANDFAQGIVDMSSAGQTNRTDETSSFYLEEQSRLAASLAALEAEVLAYKNAHADALPTQRDTLRQQLVTVEDDLGTLDQSLVALMGDRAKIEKQATLRATDRRSLQDLTARIETQEAQKAALVARRADLQTALAAIPEVERALAAYDFQLKQLQDQYEASTARLADAETERRLAERQQAERFALLERAIVPEFASSSGGRKLAMAGAVASLVAAVCLAFVMDLLHPVVRTRAQMERQLDLRPVVSIPEVPVRPRRPSGPQGGTPSGARKAGGGRGAGSAMLADLRKPLQGIPRYAVYAGGAALLLVVMAAAGVV